MSTKVSKRYVVNRVIAAGLRTYLAKYEAEVFDLAAREELAKGDKDLCPHCGEDRAHESQKVRGGHVTTMANGKHVCGTKLSPPAGGSVKKGEYDPAMCKSAGCSGGLHKCMGKSSMDGGESGSDSSMAMAEPKPAGPGEPHTCPHGKGFNCPSCWGKKPSVKKDMDEGMEMAETDATKVGGRTPVGTSVAAREWKPGTVVGTQPPKLPRRSLATANLNMPPTRAWEKSADAPEGLGKGAMDMVIGREPFKAPGTMAPAPVPGMTPPHSLKALQTRASSKSRPPPPAAALAVRKAEGEQHKFSEGRKGKCSACGKGYVHSNHHSPEARDKALGHVTSGLAGVKEPEIEKADGVPSAPRAPGAKVAKDEGDMAKKAPSPTDPVGTSKPAKLPQMHIAGKPVAGRVRDIAQRASKKAPIVGAPQNPNVDPTGKPLNPQSPKDRS